MKYHIAWKFLSFALCAVFLLLTVSAAAGVLIMADSGLYSKSVNEIQWLRMESNLRQFADSLAKRYAAMNLSNCTDLLIEKYVYDFFPPLLTPNEQKWFYTIENQRGQVLESRVLQSALDDALKLQFLITPQYPEVLDYQVEDHRPGVEAAEPPENEWLVPDETLPRPETGDYLRVESVSFESEEGMTHNYILGIREGPVYLVTLYIMPGAYARENHWSWDLAELGHTHRFTLLWVLAGSLLLFSVSLVYLLCAAGKSPDSREIRPGGLNRIPMELYFLLTAAGVGGLTYGGIHLLEWYLGKFEPIWMVFLALETMGLAAAMLLVGFLFAVAAQTKQTGWMRRTLTVRFFRSGKKICLATGSAIAKGAKATARFSGKLLRFLGRCLRTLCGLLPLALQWLIIGGLIILVLWLTLGKGGWITALGIGICAVLILYGAYCFSMLLESTKRMGQGDLESKVDDRLLLGGFRDYAEHLNALADVAVDAARKQMKSERMKAELITNISHDIKTPLTSIINYVDLLRRVESPEDAEGYLEVLDRQSQRLKKLIEDLVEMSKASTGNMHVELVSLDPVETVNQALGEFHEKLEKAGIQPLFHPLAEPVNVIADGRLMWRVLSNLLSNAVKYAMPGTRLYIDMVQDRGQVRISLKNISREPLTLTPEELTERFVRGDTSRNTEGSGLGLNIARSLMELQKGQLQLQVDGDLFKAILVFPCAPVREW